LKAGKTGLKSGYKGKEKECTVARDEVLREGFYIIDKGNI
jgi:hypothetical protein